MAATHGVGTYGNAVGTVTPLDHKMANLSHWVKTAANTIRTGVLWDGNPTIVSGTANMSYNVRAFTAVSSRGATAGAVELSNDAVYNAITTAAPGSNSRYDVVYIWQREYSIDGTDSNPVIGVVQGTAAASPTVPSLAAFPGAIALAQILVPAGVTATNSGTTITQTAPFTASAGGVVACRTTTERDAGSWQEGQDLYLIDSDRKQVYNGTAWKTISSGLVGVVPTSVAGTGVSLSTTGTVTASAATAVNINGCFTSEFDSYLIKYKTTRSAAATLQVRLRASGTDISAANYNDVTNWTNSTSAPASQRDTAVTFWNLGPGFYATSVCNGEIELDDPALASAKSIRSTQTDAAANTSMTLTVAGGFYSAATAADGITIYPASGTISGTIRIYGYNNL
jgi:hypothetical protein